MRNFPGKVDEFGFELDDDDEPDEVPEEDSARLLIFDRSF